MNTTPNNLNDMVKLPRFEFLAAYLVMLTSKKANREFVGGYQVRRAGGQWRVIQTQVAGGTVVYTHRRRDAAVRLRSPRTPRVLHPRGRQHPR